MPATFAESLKALLDPMFYDDPAQGDALDIYLEGLGDTFQIVEDYASDTDDGKPGYSLWLDMDRVPDEVLPWLAQFVGVNTITGLSTSDLREQIQKLGNWERGTVEALKSAPRYLLTGSKNVVVKERDTSPYHLEVLIDKLDMPVEDWGSTNLFINGGFETNTTGWAGGGSGTITRVVGVSRFGTASGRLDAVTTGASWVERPVNSLSAGNVYSASGYVLGTSAFPVRQLSLVVQWLNVSTLLREDVGALTTLDTVNWQRLRIEGMVAPVNTTRAKVLFRWQSPTIPGGDLAQVYIDGVQLEQQPLATPYIETDAATASAAGKGQVLRALVSQKPGGLVMNFVMYSGQQAFTMRHSAIRGVPADAVRLVV